MSAFAAFFFESAAALGALAVCLAWLFRTAPAPLFFKIAVSALFAVTACALPFRAAALMGYPIPTTKDALPLPAQLLAFSPHDKDGVVDLWLLAGGSSPTAFEIPIDGEVAKTLRQAAPTLARGDPVFLSRNSGPKDSQEGVRRGYAATRLRDEVLGALHFDTPQVPPKTEN